MDESQSSDFISETEISYSSSMIMDSVPYETLFSNIKLALSSESRKEIKKSTFSEYFTSLLEDCHSCISQALDLIIRILSDTDIKVSKVVEYMNDAVSLLQMLSGFIKTVIESVSMTCQRMKIFPTVTCDIILKIFMHCKDSEYLYGPYLSSVEKQLKDLFRTCHELQLTYLMIMEKHFVFDITENEDMEILSDTLDINLKIGDIAQTLDVKTMAEQWKAFTSICEKYTNVLLEKNIYNNSIDVLSEMISNNIKTVLEKDQEEKIILRSLKVTSFSIKILLKICGIFKHATLKNHQRVFDLLLYINSNNSAVLEMDSERSSQFLNQMNLNVSHPTELLFKELCADIKFSNYLLDYDMSKVQSEDKLLGYILIVMSMIICSLQQRDDNQRLPKHKLIIVIYNLFQHCHSHMNMGLKLPSEVKSTYESQGLYEKLLTHFLALATTLNAEEFAVLERSMIDSILGSDCMAALFTSNTWTLLARVISPCLLLNQLTLLCRLYQKLEKNKLFRHSPQKIQLSYTIRGLFEVMQKEDKLKIFKLFNVHEEQNHNLWCSLQIYNLPEDLRVETEDVIERLIMQLTNNAAAADCGEVEKLVKIFDLASTCSIRNNIIVCLIKAWNKACPKMNSTTLRDLSKETLWYLNYVSSLVSITVENMNCLQSVHLMKILHVLTEIVEIGNTELKLVVINNVCKFITLDIHDDKDTIESLLIHLLKYLSQDKQHVVKYKLYSSLREYKGSPNLHRIKEVITKDYPLKDDWDCFMNYGVLYRNDKWREQLLVKDYEYRHKCIESNIESSSGTLKKSCSGNFELVDINSLFDNESDSEQPVYKKVKLYRNEADAIISRLETDVCSLCKLKENIFTREQKTKIKCMYEQLRNISE